MATGLNLTGLQGVQKLQTILHVKAKKEPECRFHALVDKVWRMDFLTVAYIQVRRNGGVCGVDGETFADIESNGLETWLGELSGELKEDTYVPKPVRQVMIPKKQPGTFRPLGIPCIRDRVAQTSALLVLEPIIEADLQPEQYAYRPGRSANDAVKRVHGLLNTGHKEVVDGDLSNYFGEIPHAELMKSLARRVSDGRMLKLIKAWLEMPVEEDDGVVFQNNPISIFHIISAVVRQNFSRYSNFFTLFRPGRYIFPFPVVFDAADCPDVLSSPVHTHHIGAMEVVQLPPAIVVIPTRREHAEAHV